MGAKSGGRVAILTSGGDAPGMNAAVRAATLVGLSQGWEVIGVRDGYRGLVDGKLGPLAANDVQHMVREGGTLLGSARCLEFHDKGVRDRARANLREQGIDGLVVIGGNGSLTGALKLADPDECDGEPPRVIGIPASIDNDMGLTSMSIGVDTALNTIVEACDKISDTASAHSRTFLVEVMGRNCGYLAMTAAVAAGADMVLYPEAQRSNDQVVDDICKAVGAVSKRSPQSRRVIVIKAEGVNLTSPELKARVDRALEESGSKAAETRVTVLGHVVRGGRPSAFDRLLGSRLGNVAVRAIIAGETCKMTSWMPSGAIASEAGKPSEIDPKCHLIDLQTALEVTEQLLDGRSDLARWRASIFDELERVFLL